MLLSGDRDHRQAQLLELVGYNEFHDFRVSELALIEILRTMRLINYSAWLARRWTKPCFPLNYLVQHPEILVGSYPNCVSRLLPLTSRLYSSFNNFSLRGPPRRFARRRP